ncbi:MAG: AAA family ATPase [Nodosilinea sp. WJT8-NPBG4]|jgi:chromosome partitioning protein|nr:AAA family ATPase [Nodosilinea sp. WJT8-NPBG4]
MKIGNARVISFINLKGGVGKTTSAVNVAATLAHSFYVQQGNTKKRAKVLLIDLDPQSNASQTLLKSKDYDPSKTIVNLFRHELNRDDSEESFDLSKILCEAPIDGLNLDLIPSGLDLFDIQDELVKYQRYYLSATDILFNALNKLRESKRAYTHIIIDCPPSLGLVTLNGLSLSNYYIVPTFLDAYSHWGLDKIIERVETLKRCKASCEAEIIGILYSKIDRKSTRQNNMWDDKFLEWEQQNQHRFRKLAKSGGKRLVFDTKISKADVIRKAEADHSPLVAYSPADGNDKRDKEKYQEEWVALTREILNRIAILKIS